MLHKTLLLLLACSLPGASLSTDADAFWGAQLAAIDAQVASIAQSAEPGPQVYFLGFAGFGEERVFAEEIAMAEERVARRYGSGPRSLRLVNDRRDLHSLPRATAGSLAHALREVGKVMDEDDVLFLALSSHGFRGGALSITNTGMKDTALGAETLANMLREAGIRWKVIVVSACFSGRFVAPLADAHSIVITAAHRNRTSFGCSDDRDLSYFGEAFYRDALPGAKSLREAFETARSEIKKREKVEGFRASKPQAHFGKLMETKLAELVGPGFPAPPSGP